MCIQFSKYRFWNISNPAKGIKLKIETESMLRGGGVEEIGGLHTSLPFAFFDAPPLNTSKNFRKIILFKIGKTSSNYVSGDAMSPNTSGAIIVNYTLYPFFCCRNLEVQL
jgi:hypothetical protein